MNNLPKQAKRLILCVLATASMVLASALYEGLSDDPLKLAVWIVLAAIAGTIKVRFPGVESSYSFGYAAVLAAMSMLSFSGAILVSLATALVQCYWHVSKRPALVQVLFNVFNYAISGAASWYAFHGLMYVAPDLSMPVRFTFGSGVFFLLNTGLVSWILSILAERRWLDVWQKSHLLIFPYYLLGSGCVAILAWQNSTSGWLLLAILPVLGLIYASMRASLLRPAYEQGLDAHRP